MATQTMDLSNIAVTDLEAGIKEYKFYEGSETLWYDDAAHVYMKYEQGTGERIEIPGVTTVLQIIDKSHALVPWATKLCVQYLQDKLFNPDNSLAQFSTEDVLLWLTEAKDQHRAKLEEAGDIGHMAHLALEQTIQRAIDKTQGTVKQPVNIPEHELARNCFMAAIEWMRRHNVVWLYTERKIYSREYNFAGTCDGVAYVDSCDDLKCCRGKHFKHRLSVIDFKTSNALRETYDLQVAAYGFALIEELNLPITHRFILRLGKTDGAFEPRMLTPEQFEGDFNTFISAKNLSQDVGNLKKRNSKDKADLRALIKALRDEEKANAKQAEKDAKAAIKAAQKAEKEAQKQAEKDAKAAAKAAKQEPAAERHQLPANVDVSPAPEVLPPGPTDEREAMWAAMTSFSVGADGQMKDIDRSRVDLHASGDNLILGEEVERANARLIARQVLPEEDVADLTGSLLPKPNRMPDLTYAMKSRVSVYFEPTGTHIVAERVQ